MKRNGNKSTASVEKLPLKKPRTSSRGVKGKQREVVSETVEWPDYFHEASACSFLAASPSSQWAGIEEDEHVLVLEFADNSRGKKQPTGPSLSLPPAMSPNQTKKLIENRDERFRLISATSWDEDPVELVQAAARDHIPVNPKGKPPSQAERPEIPSPEDRPTVDDVIREMQEQEWYSGQIVDRRTFTTREPREGSYSRI
ncbi:hypothetical protein ID866_6201 [Astraeus odoratus]|nr:hypothetical protein ID866_6201 [Astraeus odoratus]